MNLDDAKAFILAGLISLLVVLGATAAHAADLPCPKRFYCWEVKMAVSYFGEHRATEKVRACGWPESKIAAARRCLLR